MPAKKTICFTGGGTAGHVMPNISIISSLDLEKWNVFYIGSKDIERKLVSARGIPFRRISSGKLRRYFSFQNALDIFKVFWGLLQCLGIFLLNRPSVVFSKGGFVSVPVCYAAFFLRIPVLTHESDLTPGLANKLISKIAFKVLYSFPESKKYLPASKGVLVGSLVRPELLKGSAEQGLRFLGLQNKPRKILLIMGGSLGSEQLNKLIDASLEELTKKFIVVHIKGKSSAPQSKREGYFPLSFVDQELADLLACVDLVISRAGANAIFEFLALRIPMLLIPLRAGSRGDQVDNANNFAKNGYAEVLDQEEITAVAFLQAVKDLELHADSLAKAMSSQSSYDSFDKVHRLLSEAL